LTNSGENEFSRLNQFFKLSTPLFHPSVCCYLIKSNRPRVSLTSTIAATRARATHEQANCEHQEEEQREQNAPQPGLMVQAAATAIIPARVMQNQALNYELMKDFD
jgi:hypothetical protein